MMFDNFSSLSFAIGMLAGAILSLSLVAGVTFGILAISVTEQREREEG
ncbi:MAG: hypothetical protein AAGC88_06340 [Bacteroidota bacterium]